MKFFKHEIPYSINRYRPSQADSKSFPKSHYSSFLIQCLKNLICRRIGRFIKWLRLYNTFNSINRIVAEPKAHPTDSTKKKRYNPVNWTFFAYFRLYNPIKKLIISVIKCVANQVT